MTHRTDPAEHNTSTIAPRRRRWGSGRGPIEPSDSVVIDDESHHDWWARRDELSRAVSPKKRSRTEAAAPATDAAAAAFAPATQVNEPASHGAWDVESLYSWGAAGVDAEDSSPSTPAPAYRSPWEILSLTPDAHWLEVVRRHRTLAKQFHPDLHATKDLATRRSVEVQMAEINAAFDELLGYYGMHPGDRATG